MWDVDEAGKRLEEVIRHAADQGPQPIVEKGKRVAMLLSFEEYERLLAQKLVEAGKPAPGQAGS